MWFWELHIKAEKWIFIPFLGILWILNTLYQLWEDSPRFCLLLYQGFASLAHGCSKASVNLGPYNLIQAGLLM